MMQTWKKYGVDEKLKQIYEKDSAVLTGISAGAICWFYCGHSDSEASHNEDNGKYCWATAKGVLVITPSKIIVTTPDADNKKEI